MKSYTPQRLLCVVGPDRVMDDDVCPLLPFACSYREAGDAEPLRQETDKRMTE